MFFKFILFSIIGFYIVSKLIGFLFRTLVRMSGADPQRSYSKASNNTRRKPVADSNLDIDYIPEDKKSKGTFKGGDYVDFEEVK